MTYVRIKITKIVSRIYRILTQSHKIQTTQTVPTLLVKQQCLDVYLRVKCLNCNVSTLRKFMCMSVVFIADTTNVIYLKKAEYMV